MWNRFARLTRMDLQVKVIVVLFAVIVPTFLAMTVVQNRIARPVLETEARRTALTVGKNIATEVISQGLLASGAGQGELEALIRETLYQYPNIIRIDILKREPGTGALRLLLSNFMMNPAPSYVENFKPVLAPSGRYLEEDARSRPRLWEVTIPIVKKSSAAKKEPREERLRGYVRVLLSLESVNDVLSAFWRISWIATSVSVVLLIVLLGFFLRKTILNERRLHRAESENTVLSSHLHELERELMNTEKMAAMGQLASKVAHDIGTPLNAMSGHLQLLEADIRAFPAQVPSTWHERLAIIDGQVGRIAEVVRGFLQTTSKPVTQRQLVDVNRSVRQVMAIFQARFDAMGVQVFTRLDDGLGPVRIVPMDLEQVLQNVFENSLDSLREKKHSGRRVKLQIELETRLDKVDGREWALIRVTDTGVGANRESVAKLLKPFYTTKAPGAGTGLGLTICNEIVRKYGGILELNSKEGVSFEVVIRLPYQFDV